ncbi:MAG TPA: biosynthetic peptidoglycan transglycosylase, partial [Polyangiaceae bacterium]|nr:biosynthetic peptidoglycan transglycosylase [Polyangiaceae bacterium]
MSVLLDLPRRTRSVALLGAALALFGIGVLSFGPVVRALAKNAAERRGAALSIAEVHAGFAGIWLKDLDLRVPLMPSVKAHIAALRVDWGWHFNVVGIALHGASVELSGDSEQLAREYAAYRAALPKSNARGELHYLFDGIDLIWSPEPQKTAQRAWGLRYERNGDRESISLDLARFAGAGVALEARAPELKLRRVNGERKLDSVRADGLSLEISLESAPNSGVPRRMISQAAPKPEAFRPDPERGVKLRAALSLLSQLAARTLPEGAALDLAGVRVRFLRGAEALNIGPSELHVERQGEDIAASLVPKAEASGTPLELRLWLPLDHHDVRAEVRGGPVSLHSLGVKEGDLGLVHVQSATLQARSDVTLSADGSTLAFSGNGVLDQISLSRPELSPSPLSGIHLSFRVRGTTNLDGSRLELEDGEVALGEVHLQGNGVLARSEHALQTHWSGGVPLASCQALLDATPRGLVPLIAPLRMTGTFALKAELAYDSEHPDDTRVHLDVANDCRVGQIPAELSPHRFESAWQREVKGPDKQPLEIESGPGSPDWVPYEAISPFMEAAVLVCEDGHFERHHGFDYEAIQNSIKDNLIKGRFVRGASTISMQLARNLYLGKEKTLGRKLQEAVLTLLLEQELDKRALMELYLNVIEYGPGIYGIGP